MLCGRRGDGLLGELVGRGDAFFYPGESRSQISWRSFAAPWIANDIHDSLKTMTEADATALFFSAPPGTFARFNGSPFYITKIPDLIGMKDRKYIDHTATHQQRGPADIMRYAGLVSCCDTADFGSHRMLTDAQRRILYKLPDELAFALVQYLYSLEPPANPNLGDARAAAGKRVFDRERCATCHTAPLYTNNRLTPAVGFTPPRSRPLASDIMSVSVGTDPELALKTRKGAGLYKVSSLKGVWYREVCSTTTAPWQVWRSGSTRRVFAQTSFRLGSRASRCPTAPCPVTNMVSISQPTTRQL